MAEFKGMKQNMMSGLNKEMKFEQLVESEELERLNT